MNENWERHNEHVLISLYRVWQVNFLFHTAFHIQKRKLSCRTLYNRIKSNNYEFFLQADTNCKCQLTARQQKHGRNVSTQGECVDQENSTKSTARLNDGSLKIALINLSSRAVSKARRKIKVTKQKHLLSSKNSTVH
jgi:hypothetical protein